jgi:cytochrome d ubiquinol oxidase subunit II
VSTAVAVVLLAAVVAYAVFGGADFGAGFWDLTAGGPERGARPRALIEHSIGPVWEANHVWLIFIFVVLWTSFPEAYASITLTLFVPLMIAALGIVLRGVSFAFRKVVVTTRNRRIFGAGFAASSVLVPYCMGAIAGGISSGRVPAGGQAGDPVNSWINPTSVVGGVLAVAAAAYLSAVYLVWDARRLNETDMAQYFRRRAVASAIVVAVIAAGGAVVLRADADYLFDGHLQRRLRRRRCPAAGSRRRPGRPSPRPGRGRRRRHLLGCGPVALHPAAEPDVLHGRGPVRHVDRHARRGGPRRRCRAPRVRPALRPRSTRSPSRGGRRRRG